MSDKNEQQPAAWLVERDSEHEGPEVFFTAHEANQNARLGENRTTVTPLYRLSVVRELQSRTDATDKDSQISEQIRVNKELRETLTLSESQLVNQIRLNKELREKLARAWELLKFAEFFYRSRGYAYEAERAKAFLSTKPQDGDHDAKP